MDPLLFMIVTLIAAILAGAFGSLLGLGGGIIIVPVLTLLLGVDIRYAIGASIVSVIATSSGAAATYVRDHITNMRVGMFLEMGTTTGAITGAFLAGILSGQLLYLIFAVVLGYSTFVMWQKRNQELPVNVPEDPLATRLKLHSSYYDNALKKQVNYRVTGIPQGLALMFVAGTVSGLLGIGSGSLKVPAMDIFMKLPMKVSSATSNFMIGVTAAASAGLYFTRGQIQPFIAAPVALGVLIGSIAGTRLLMRMKSSAIRKVFILVLVVVTVQMLLRGLNIQLG